MGWEYLCCKKDSEDYDNMITMCEKSHVCFVCVCWGNRMVVMQKRKCLHLWLGKAFGGVHEEGGKCCAVDIVPWVLLHELSFKFYIISLHKEICSHTSIF